MGLGLKLEEMPPTVIGVITALSRSPLRTVAVRGVAQ